MAYPRTDLEPQEQNRETARVFHGEDYATIRRYVGELLLAQDTGVEPASEADEKKYREMIMELSGGKNHAE